jgi:molecular chaperone HtpG
MGKETFAFQAEVSKLLDIVARSLYSHKEIFLRELISNASDACDKARYAALTDPKMAGNGGFKIALAADAKARTLTVSDNGIGMNRADLTELLGTIARSGTQAFLDQLTGDQAKDMALIGQFGVGFYSAFMVAKSVEVVTRKAGDDQAWIWRSDGRGEFTVEEGKRDGRGTDVILHMNEGEDEFLDPQRIRHIVRAYSDHIGIPIVLKDDKKEETINTASALWTRDKKDITEAQYKEFYHHVAHGFDDPWLTIHNKVEGVVAYTNLLFIPSRRPFDLFRPERTPHVKLYVRRVYITDDCEALMPPYLRFVRGVVDSDDIALNISREMLQRDPKLAKIRSGLVKRVLGEIKRKADQEPDSYTTFWDAFGPVLKEGIYEDPSYRDEILALARFRSTAGEDWVSLDTYVGRMKEGQDAIYYITGETAEAAAKSPQLEGFRARGVEALLMTDPVDEFWIGSVEKYRDKPFKSASRGGTDLDKIPAKEGDRADAPAPADAGALDVLIATFKGALKDAVKDVRMSKRLTDSPVCLVADEGDMDMHLERLLKQHRYLGAGTPTPRILELNPTHPLIRRLAELAKNGRAASDAVTDAAFLLLDQARIIEGESVADPAAFAKRLAGFMAKGLA